MLRYLTKKWQLLNVTFIIDNRLLSNAKDPKEKKESQVKEKGFAQKMLFEAMQLTIWYRLVTSKDTVLTTLFRRVSKLVNNSLLNSFRPLFSEKKESSFVLKRQKESKLWLGKPQKNVQLKSTRPLSSLSLKIT